MHITTVAVVGAGIMSSSIALDLACHDLTIILKDVDEERLKSAKDRIASGFRMAKMMKKAMKGISLDEILSKIRFTTAYDGFTDADLVIESVTEDWDTKQRVYRELRRECREDAVYATNTSCISVTRVAALLPKPDRVIGTHFMNPVPLKTLVEVIRGHHTSSETEDAVTNFLKGIEKKSVVVNDSTGFVANRLSHLFMNEAAFLVLENVALPKEIDLIFKEGYGHKMGPLETADLIGLDTVVQSLEVLYNSYQDPKFRCCPLLRKMVHAGLLGRKSGQGFYTYS